MTPTKKKKDQGLAKPLFINKFPLGRLVSTQGALDALEEEELHKLVQRHAACDWGECCDHDRQANEDALKSGARIFSAYRSRRGEKIWVITEADRRSTCVLLPSEY